ncbi:type VI secretion system tip protein VgrG [Chitinophaga sp. CC14]|uniref:type VI secretion system tip protein VgrG n=1 Tax=Chitinophaga TaxID=79328 RepID=UPI000DB902BE|nr:type VI secretion system tip protein VgrG [Chitinophaga ginsengisegetis]MDR6570909.1 Rhs element Vgr protein [Chitinophaga ginsengisegetis]MDR6650643.1 Rhs element Vgr protein [Chitinophaga ginsengisegetis]MDR6656993.1 Rhs element Vgr protein [Chitinophaga ginsengisegetis]
MAAVVPINIADPTLQYTITANGTAVQYTYPVISVTIHHELNRISWAEIMLSDGTTAKASTGVIGDFPASDSDSFLPGNTVTITAGYGNTGEELIFTGVVVKQSIQATDQGFHLIVTCKHSAVQMTITKKDAVFINQTDSAIMSTTVSNNGLSGDIQSTSAINELVFQKFCTDWDFLLSRAEFNGFVVSLVGAQIVAAPPVVSGEPVVSVAFGESLINFNASVSAEKQVPSLTAAAWDPQTLAMITATAAEPGLNAQGNLEATTLASALHQTPLQLVSNSPLAQESLQSWANSTLLRMRLESISGQVSFMGNATVWPNTLITLAGVGSRFNGNAYVWAVTHTLKEGVWNTNAKFGLNSKPIYERENFSYSPANGQLPAIQGLQLGTVVAISQDPGAEYRVQVMLATTATGQQGTWARLSTFYATESAGAIFFPEVGDEVVVAFIENDPRYPVIIGSLYGKMKTPPVIPADNNNYIKALYTKSQLKITFDDENKIITVITPGGNSIALNDMAQEIVIQDQSSNSITMAPAGVTINSASDLTLQATGQLKLNGMAVNVAATTALEMSGATLSMSADTTLSATGNASATLSSSASTIIQGGVVMIN